MSVKLHYTSKKKTRENIKPTAENQDGKQIEQKPEPGGRRLETSLPAVVKMSHLHMSNTVDVENSRNGLMVKTTMAERQKNVAFSALKALKV